MKSDTKPLAGQAITICRLLLEYPKGLYGSELIHLSGGNLTRGGTYTLLGRMIQDGLLDEEVEAANHSYNRDRIRYYISKEGEAAFMKFLKSNWLELAPYKKESK